MDTTEQTAMKEAERGIDFNRTNNPCLRLCIIIIITLWISMSCFYSSADDNKPVNVTIHEGLSKELEDSLIKAEKEGKLIQYYARKEEKLRDEGKYGDIINISNWIEKRLPKKDITNITLVYELRSSAYYLIGDYEAMFDDIEKSLDIPKDKNLLFRDGILYLWIMDFHLTFKRLDLAQKYLDKAKKIVSDHGTILDNEYGWKDLNYLIHLMQGQFYRFQKDWEAANSEYIQAEKYSISKRHKEGIITQKFFLYKDKGEYEVADSIYHVYILNNSHIPFLEIGNIRMEYIHLLLLTGKFEDAKTELKRLHPDSIHISDVPNLYALTSDIFEIDGKPTLAYYYLQKYIHLKDSLETEYKRTYTKQATDRFETRQIKKSLERERLENIRNITLIGVLIIVLIGIGILLIIIIRLHKKRKHEQAITENNLGNRNAALSSATMVADNYKNIYQDIKEILNSEESTTKKLTDISMRLKDSSISIEPLHHVNNSNEEVMQEFMDKLRYIHPNLTNAEMRMAQLVLMNISNKDIAELQNRSLGTIKNQKYSLRKKLGTDLPTEVYLKQLSAASPSELEELAIIAQKNVSNDSN
ncbi:MAG: hypothetical protein HDR88_12905 [Bacteroides sp.]|nr:hypothetical protein [Bacteroides sp.]